MLCGMLCGRRRVSVVHDAVAVKQSRLAWLLCSHSALSFFRSAIVIAWLALQGRV
jgi:hypothetical protein